jgi:hypothetical protein
MHDQPEPTEEEHEHAPERLEEGQAKTGGHEDPEQHEDDQ